MNTLDAIKTRCSVRKFTDYIVTDHEIHEILSMAGLSASWANTQVWEFIVIRDRAMIEKVVATWSETNPARKGALQCSVLIVLCAKTGSSGCKEGEPTTKFREWFMFDLGMAAQNLTLAARELGLGTVVVGSMDHDRCASLLNVPAGYELVAVMPLGRPADPDKTGPKKRDPGEFIHRETF